MLWKIPQTLSTDTIPLGGNKPIVNRAVFSLCASFSYCLPLLVFSTAAPGKRMSCGLEQDQSENRPREAGVTS